MENTNTTTSNRRVKLTFNKFGLTQNPIGGHCVYTHEGRQLLGEVKGIVRKGNYSSHLHLQVTFFNGESWPIDPLASMVEMLVRD